MHGLYGETEIVRLLSLKALGDDRRSFSYYKAIGVIEKVPFKIESADQVKDLPTIGKSMQDHVSVHKFKLVSSFQKNKKEFQLVPCRCCLE